MECFQGRSQEFSRGTHNFLSTSFKIQSTNESHRFPGNEHSVVKQTVWCFRKKYLYLMIWEKKKCAFLKCLLFYYSLFDFLVALYPPIKHNLRVYWTTSNTFLEKRVSKVFITMTLLWTLEIRIRKKHYLWNYCERKSNLTRSYTCLEIFQSTNNTNRRGPGVLFQSFSEVCCWFSPLLREVFLRVLRFSPLLKKPTFPNSNSTRNQVDEEPLCGCATSKSLFIYLFIY